MSAQVLNRHGRPVIERPEWLTDEEVDELARRTHMAMCEAGAMNGEMYAARNWRNAYYFETDDHEMFERARLLALTSMGLHLNENNEIVR